MGQLGLGAPGGGVVVAVAGATSADQSLHTNGAGLPEVPESGDASFVELPLYRSTDTVDDGQIVAAVGLFAFG